MLIYRCQVRCCQHKCREDVHCHHLHHDHQLGVDVGCWGRFVRPARSHTGHWLTTRLVPEVARHPGTRQGVVGWLVGWLRGAGALQDELANTQTKAFVHVNLNHLSANSVHFFVFFFSFFLSLLPPPSPPFFPLLLFFLYCLFAVQYDWMASCFCSMSYSTKRCVGLLGSLLGLFLVFFNPKSHFLDRWLPDLHYHVVWVITHNLKKNLQFNNVAISGRKHISSIPSVWLPVAAAWARTAPTLQQRKGGQNEHHQPQQQKKTKTVTRAALDSKTIVSSRMVWSDVYNLYRILNFHSEYIPWSSNNQCVTISTALCGEINLATAKHGKT